MGVFKKLFGGNGGDQPERPADPPIPEVEIRIDFGGHTLRGRTGEANYYVYVHAGRDDRVFYVGKGTGDRAWSRVRHDVWKRYVDKYLGGEYSVHILRDNLTEEEALTVESDLLNQYGEHLVNWINPGRKLDSEAFNEFSAKRMESQRLTRHAQEVAKEDPAAAIPICHQALDLVHEYSQLTIETGLVEQVREKNRNGDPTVGDPHVIYRLAQCLKRAGDLEGLVREVDAYFARYPDAASHTPGQSALKLRERTAAKLAAEPNA